ncbi:MAG: L-aspartate oxidase [Gammaproteobacteria bacterium]|nr:L-aspartate oxidase [Gammaproteobacteria bacterium]
MRIETAGTVVVGSGIAGLSAALALGSCVILTRSELGSGSSRHAQGGIAAAIGPDDDPAAHAADTVTVGSGLNDRLVVDAVTAAAPDRIRWLEELGARFDHRGSRLVLGREAGHSTRRIVHADGDATGAEVMRTLVAAVRARAEIDVLTGYDLVDLVRNEGRVTGILALDPIGEPILLLASAVVLATGGIGQLFLHTTNPREVTGDGLAAAARAGAELADLEFMQFHPTALAVPADPLPLLTEALRGEGALLVDGQGERIMEGVHPDAELAPRDLVARAVWRRMEQGHQIGLDATHLGERFLERFPTVWEAADTYGLDPRREPLPVTPAAHFHMGGIATDARGRTSLPGLWAVGEVASTGLHGANRLASNSLLEGMAIAASLAGDVASVATLPAADPGRLEVPADALSVDRGRDPAAIDSIRETAWRWVGIIRDASGLGAAREYFGLLGRTGLVERNLRAVGELIAAAALARTESRGAHFRSDYPTPDPAQAHRSLVRPDAAPSATTVPRSRI